MEEKELSRQKHTELFNQIECRNKKYEIYEEEI